MSLAIRVVFAGALFMIGRAHREPGISDDAGRGIPAASAVPSRRQLEGAHRYGDAL